MKSQDVKLLMQHNVTLYFQGERRRLMHRCCPSVRSSVRLSVAKIRIQKKRFSQNVYLLCCILMRNKVYNPELGERESCCSYNSVLSSYRIYTFFRFWLPEACSFTGMTCVTFGNQSIIRIDCHMTINCFNCCSCRHISSVNTLTVLCSRGLDFQTLLNSKYSSSSSSSSLVAKCSEFYPVETIMATAHVLQPILPGTSQTTGLPVWRRAVHFLSACQHSADVRLTDSDWQQRRLMTLKMNVGDVGV